MVFCSSTKLKLIIFKRYYFRLSFRSSLFSNGFFLQYVLEIFCPMLYGIESESKCRTFRPFFMCNSTFTGSKLEFGVWGTWEDSSYQFHLLNREKKDENDEDIFVFCALSMDNDLKPSYAVDTSWEGIDYM